MRLKIDWTQIRNTLLAQARLHASTLRRWYKEQKHSEFWKRFRNNLPATLSLWVFLGILGISLGAPFIANDRPLVMRYQGAFYFPVLNNYLPKDFGQLGFVVDYLAFEKEIEKDGFALFPLIKQRPYDQNLNFEKLPAPPGSRSQVRDSQDNLLYETFHLLGTDTGGRDLLTRLIYGCRTSLGMAMAITALSLLLGCLLGALMGYRGGIFDLVTGRILESLGYFPIIFLIIILVAFIENPSLTSIVVIFSVTGLSPFAFYMRGEVLRVRKLTYVRAALALGQSDLKIIFRHIFPNAFSPILVLIPFTITSNITFLATIDFLGFGVQPPTASLGAILRSGYEDISNRWWLVAASTVVLVVILLLVNFIGDGVRDGLDPHASINRKRIKELEESEQGRRVLQPSGGPSQ